MHAFRPFYRLAALRYPSSCSRVSYHIPIPRHPAPLPFAATVITTEQERIIQEARAELQSLKESVGAEETVFVAALSNHF